MNWKWEDLKNVVEWVNKYLFTWNVTEMSIKNIVYSLHSNQIIKKKDHEIKIETVIWI